MRDIQPWLAFKLAEFFFQINTIIKFEFCHHITCIRYWSTSLQEREIDQHVSRSQKSPQLVSFSHYRLGGLIDSKNRYTNIFPNAPSTSSLLYPQICKSTRIKPTCSDKCRCPLKAKKTNCIMQLRTKRRSTRSKLLKKIVWMIPMVQ